jgi:hypothetical protein
MKRFAFIPSSPAPLEERIAPSPAGFAGTVRTPTAMRRLLDLNLSGFVLGNQTTVGTEHRLHATGGTIAPLGTVSLNGFLMISKSVGANRPAHGSVTISNAQGSITVGLAGKVTVFNGPFVFASGTLRYKIVSGTKADLGATGSGPVLYGPGPALQPGRFLLDFGNFPPPP